MRATHWLPEFSLSKGESFLSIIGYKNNLTLISKRDIVRVHYILCPILYPIRLSEKCLSFTNTSFTMMHLYTNMKANLSNMNVSLF